MEIDPEVKETLQREFISAIKSEGLLLVPHEVGVNVISFYKKQQALLRQKSVTPYQIANYNLIPGTRNLGTIRNWIDSGKIKADEWYLDNNNRTHVMVSAVIRINHE